MTNCSAEMDNAIAKLHQNFQELRYHLEKAFLEEGRALLKFEAQWNDLKKEGRKDLAHHEDNLQRMGISVPSIGTEAATSNLNAPLRSNATANPNATSWSNTNANPNVLYWSNTIANPNAPYWSSVRPSGNGTPTPRPSGNGTLKFHCDVCNINCDTKAVLDKHKQGKKHVANLDKLKGKYVPGQSTGKKKAAHQSVEDLEIKRRKVLESGAAPHALRTCSICNVVSLSVMDFNIHCVGQRHTDAVAALARKHGAGSSGASSHSLLNRRF